MQKNKHFGAELAKVMPLIFREFTRRQKNLFSKGYLTVPQVVILELLSEKGPVQMNGLARTLNFTMSAVTAIVDKMIQMKLVKRERSSQDRRVVKVILLNKGSQMAKQVYQARSNCAEELFASLTKKDKGEYIRILNKVYRNLRQNHEQG